MKILIVNTTDTEGGAARAAYRLHQGLQGIGLISQMLVQDRRSNDPNVMVAHPKLTAEIGKLRSTLNKVPTLLYPQRDRLIFSSQWVPDHLGAQVKKIAPDLINLHWFCDGYIQLETLRKLNQPLVWTLHDMWGFTGGCHYSQECDRYTNSCGSCPQLHSAKDSDLSRWIWERKVKAWQNIDLTIVTPSVWLAECVKASSLLKNRRVEVIPNGIDLHQYKPINRTVAREILNLPPDKKLVVFGAMSATSDRRKGFQYLQPAFLSLSQNGWAEQIELLIFGSSAPPKPPDFGFKTHYLGYLKDDISLSLVYAAADVFVAPSIQEVGPLTVMEAMGTGTPCVGFNIGGVPDMIDHHENGYIATPFESEDLARGIAWILADSDRFVSLSQKARVKIEQKFTMELQARSYSKLYQEVLSNSTLNRRIS